MQTRAQKATELRRLLNQGPALQFHVFGPVDIAARLTPEQNAEIKRAVQNWLDTWVSPLCTDLIKELRSE